VIWLEEFFPDVTKLTVLWKWI